jgi:hypothetical protein
VKRKIAWKAVAGALVASAIVGGGAAAQAQTVEAPASPNPTGPERSATEREIQALRESLAAAERRISDLERLMAEQRLSGAAPTAATPELAARGPAPLGAEGALAEIRGAGEPGVGGPDPVIRLAQAQSAPPSGPVGEAPAQTSEPIANVVAALPDNTGVLTRPGHFVFEPSITYSRSSSNRLVFRGVEIVTGVQIGVIEANDAARDTLIGTGTLRYGLTNRAEVELRVPYIHRNDRITTVAQRDDQLTRTQRLDATDIGDVEFTGRYQLNAGGPERPIVVANLRVKSDTGSSPYEVRRDEFGVAQELATGSGFWSIEPSISTLLVSDPAVIFANISYLHSFSKDIDKTIGNVLVGKVTPGDSIGASLGFGFSLNPRFSFSLGYRHNYIFRSKTELGPTIQKSESLQVGSLLFGMSYRFTEKRSVNTQFEFGVTSDAPNVGITVRMPFAS